ncbi:hypothetical protein [Halorussus amylolyticus]|uniref:hypothetical protein n=1 Tax=Halorussus amylolyticus TaxID=1126242 RepID=UPI001047BB99|nr:hypothetical protein [Halorussus amylolyticus]
MASSEKDGGEINPVIAKQLARNRLADRLRPPAESQQSDIAQFVDRTAKITRALENGETPNRHDLGTARSYLKELEERIDEVTKLYGWNPWDTGANWGELSEEDQVEVELRDDA